MTNLKFLFTGLELFVLIISIGVLFIYFTFGCANQVLVKSTHKPEPGIVEFTFHSGEPVLIDTQIRNIDELKLKMDVYMISALPGTQIIEIYPRNIADEHIEYFMRVCLSVDPVRCSQEFRTKGKAGLVFTTIPEFFVVVEATLVQDS